MKLKDVFSKTGYYGLESFVKEFRLVTAANADDVAFVLGAKDADNLMRSCYGEADGFLGRLVNVGWLEYDLLEASEFKAITPARQQLALLRLLNEDQSEILGDLELGDAVVIDVTDAERLFSLPLLQYMKPHGEGCSQLSERDWATLKLENLV